MVKESITVVKSAAIKTAIDEENVCKCAFYKGATKKITLYKQDIDKLLVRKSFV